MDFNPMDFLVRTYKAPGSGQWGSDNSTTITHLPTGLHASCEDKSTPQKQQALAMAKLKELLTREYTGMDAPWWDYGCGVLVRNPSVGAQVMLVHEPEVTTTGRLVVAGSVFSVLYAQGPKVVLHSIGYELGNDSITVADLDFIRPLDWDGNSEGLYPMATAPKDGSVVLLHFHIENSKHDYVLSAYWHNELHTWMDMRHVPVYQVAASEPKGWEHTHEVTK